MRMFHKYLKIRCMHACIDLKSTDLWQIYSMLMSMHRIDACVYFHQAYVLINKMHACMHRIDAYECKKSVGLQAKLAMIRDIFASIRIAGICNPYVCMAIADYSKYRPMANILAKDVCS